MVLGYATVALVIPELFTSLAIRQMPGYVKVGRTGGNSPEDVLSRMRDLDKTGVPRAFYCEYAAVVADHKEAEQVLLTAFGENRVRRNREFLEDIPPYRVTAIVKHLALKNVTPGPGLDLGDAGLNPDEASSERPPRTPSVKFSRLGIEPGDSLEWADDPNISCQVIRDGRVSYEGCEYAISQLTAKLRGGRAAYLQVQPYWLFKDQTLGELWSNYLSSEDNGGSGGQVKRMRPPEHWAAHPSGLVSPHPLSRYTRKMPQDAPESFFLGLVGSKRVLARFVWKSTARRRQPPDFRLHLQAGLLSETAKVAGHTGLRDAGIWDEHDCCVCQVKTLVWMSQYIRRNVTSSLCPKCKI